MRERCVATKISRTKQHMSKTISIVKKLDAISNTQKVFAVILMKRKLIVLFW